MTPDLMAKGTELAQAHAKLEAEKKQGQTESGGRGAGFSRMHKLGEVDTAHGRILYLEDVCVSFDGFKAINNLSLDIAPGELRCIIGPNGAGKTTMMDIITGGKHVPTQVRFSLVARLICYATKSLKLRKWVLGVSSKNQPCLSNSQYSKI